jgi:protein TonB
MAKALAISAAAHLAIVSLIQPATRPVDSVMPNYEIQARLSTPPDVPEPASEALVPVTVKPAPSPPVHAEEHAAEPPSPLPARTLSQPPADSEPDARNPESATPGPEQSRRTFLPQVPIIVDPNYYSAKEVDIHPRALVSITPAYPDEARRREVVGEVTLKLLLDESGRVQSAEVVAARPSGYFEQSALEAFRAGKFAPAYKDGRAVRSLVLIRVNYELE